MMRLFDSNKAQGSNYITAIVFLIMFAFMSLIGVLYLSNFLDAIESSAYNEGQMQTAINIFRNSFYWWDYILLALVVVFIIGSAITSYMLRTNAVGYIVTFIMAIFWGFISYVMNYLFIQLYSHEAFITVTAYFPRTAILLTNCHWIMLALIVFGSIGLYAKKQTDIELLS